MESILGQSKITKEQAISFILEKNPDPKIDCPISDFIDFYIKESSDEGIRWDVALAQSIHETGFFRFGGQVLPLQHNYAGIGALNGEAVGKGAWFATPERGIRAQVQHLVAYCSTKALTKECIDPRFNLVNRGCAKNVEDLAGKWAVPGYDRNLYKSFDEAFNNGATYGQLILKMIDEIKKESKGEINMNIIDAGLQFRNLGRYNNTPQSIVIHHIEARSATVQDIHSWHLENGWSGIGYHYYIRKDGSVYKGRPDDAQGAHVAEFNHNSLGVSFEGDYDKDGNMPEAQYNAWCNLKAYLSNKYGNMRIYGHREVGSSACPGRYFPLDRIKGATGGNVSGGSSNQNSGQSNNGFSQRTQYLQILCNQLGVKDQNGNTLSQDGLMGPCSEYAIRHLPLLGLPYVNRAATAHIQNLLGLNADGIFGSGTYAAVRKWQMEHGLSADGIVGGDTWMTFA